MMVRPSMEHHLYMPEERAHSLDKIVEHAERSGVYLKLVLMDANDKIYLKMADDGSWAAADNPDGFYGLGRGHEQDPLAAADVVALRAGAVGLLAEHSLVGADERGRSRSHEALPAGRRVRQVHALPGVRGRARNRRRQALFVEPSQRAHGDHVVLDGVSCPGVLGQRQVPERGLRRRPRLRQHELRAVRRAGG